MSRSDFAFTDNVRNSTKCFRRLTREHSKNFVSGEPDKKRSQDPKKKQSHRECANKSISGSELTVTQRMFEIQPRALEH